mmetsp:Transcript_12571/g.35833  ORF Transcript_12571/g.35833 Transcript_12571/m.35833 type:complete len:548 (+) Transcript_12571:299-1942(+)
MFVCYAAGGDGGLGEETASESNMDYTNTNDPQGTSMFQSWNVSTDHLADFAEAKKRKGGGRRAGGITLKLLIEDGLISPGKHVLSVEYKTMTHVADLTDDGKIEVNVNGRHMVFDSPSAFSIYLKRLSNPSRKADDGWKSVRYNGNLLEHYKLEFARKRVGGGTMEELFPRRTYNKKPKPLFVNDPEPPPSPPRGQRPRQAVHVLIGADTAEYLVELADHDPIMDPQPFHLQVAPVAEAVMDIHAHLCYDEVAGVLLGTYHSESTTMNVLVAVPVETKPVGVSVAKVQVDEEDLENRVKAAISKSGGKLEVVGRYHSHPDFSSRPSLIDVVGVVRDQIQARAAAGGSSTNVVPQINCILSPYDKADIPQDDRAVEMAPCTWYHVTVPPSLTALDDNVSPLSLGCVPYRTRAMVLSGEKPSNEDVSALEKTVEELAKRYASSPDRANIMGLWRKTGQDRVVLRLRKMIQSFEAKLKKGAFEGKLRNFAQYRLEVLLRAIWSVYGPEEASHPATVTPGANQSAAVATVEAPEKAGCDGEPDEEVSEITQ